MKFADTYISWKLIDLFDFESEQKSTVKAETTELVKNFRKNKFPALSEFFSKSAEEFSQLDFKSEEAVRNWVSQKTNESDDFLNSLQTELTPYASKVASLVEKDNWQSFLKNFEKENKKILGTKSKCESKFEDNLEDWIGDLSDSQEEAIESYCEARGPHQEIRVRNRNHMLETFQSLAEPKGEFNKESFTAAIPRWVKSYRNLQHPDSKERWEQNKENLKKTFTSILMNSTESQRKKFSDQLLKRSQSFKRLSL